MSEARCNTHSSLLTNLFCLTASFLLLCFTVEIRESLNESMQAVKAKKKWKLEISGESLDCYVWKESHVDRKRCWAGGGGEPSLGLDVEHSSRLTRQRPSGSWVWFRGNVLEETSFQTCLARPSVALVTLEGPVHTPGTPQAEEA